MYTIGGLLFVGVVVWLVERSRNTDLSDPTEGVTSAFKQSASESDSPLRFSDVTVAKGIEMRHGNGIRQRALVEDNGSGLAWGDYDGDGDWDLYFVNFPGLGNETPDPSCSNKLYRNDGDGFIDVTADAKVSDLNGFGMGATFVDYDGDGDVDLYVTNVGPNRLFQNQGDGTFIDIAKEAGVDDPLWGVGVAWGDYDRDGHIDLYVCNYVDYNTAGMEPGIPEGYDPRNYEAPYTINPNAYDAQPNRLYRNQGDGTFEDVTAACEVVNKDGRSLAATFCDFNGDGWLDLYVNNDVSPNRFYQNSGSDFGADEPIFFIDLSAVTGTADPRGSMGLSIGEIGHMTDQQDGLPDLFITHWIAQENAFYQSQLDAVGTLEYRDKSRLFRLGEISIDRVGWGSALADLDLDGNIDIIVANGSTLEQKENPLLLKNDPLFLFLSNGRTFQNVEPFAGTGQYNARGLAIADYDRDGDIDIAISNNQGSPKLLENRTPHNNHSLSVILSGPAARCFGAKVEVITESRTQIAWWGSDVSYLGMHAPELIFGLGKQSAVKEIRVHWTDGKLSTLENVSEKQINISYP